MEVDEPFMGWRRRRLGNHRLYIRWRDEDTTQSITVPPRSASPSVAQCTCRLSVLCIGPWGGECSTLLRHGSSLDWGCCYAQRMGPPWIRGEPTWPASTLDLHHEVRETL
jgi:hypothetical protein